MPVQLPDAAGIQAHVHAGDALRHAQLAFGNLARPAAALLPDMRVGKGEAQVGKRAVIGRGRTSRSGFCRSLTRLRGPGSVPPCPGRCGCGTGSPVCAPAAVAAVNNPPTAAAANNVRRVGSSIIFTPISIAPRRFPTSASIRHVVMQRIVLFRGCRRRLRLPFFSRELAGKPEVVMLFCPVEIDLAAAHGFERAFHPERA